MRHALAVERSRRCELVVCLDEGRPAVQHGDAERLELFERPEAGLDAVERAQHVEPAERDIASAQAAERPSGRQHRPEPRVGRRGPVRDDEEVAHLTTIVLILIKC